MAAVEAAFVRSVGVSVEKFTSAWGFNYLQPREAAQDPQIRIKLNPDLNQTPYPQLPLLPSPSTDARLKSNASRTAPAAKFGSSSETLFCGCIC